MLATLHIRDYALIDELDIRFGPGLNILTGPTGAGKSILIGALNLVLGERADTDVIRRGAPKAIAEAEFERAPDPVLDALLREADIEAGATLILRREVRESGSRAFVNDTPVTVQTLKRIGERLVDLHGQHDHQLLLREEHHRETVDALPEVVPARRAWTDAWAACTEAAARLKDLRRREADLRQRQELMRFQLRELEAARLDPDEWDTLAAEMKRLDSADDLLRLTGEIRQLGMDAEPNAADLLRRLERLLETLADIEPGFGSYRAEIEAARISVEEVVREADRYGAGIEHDPARLEQLRGRQAEWRRLEKKYGRTPAELVAWQAELAEELHLADHFELEIERAEEALAAARQRMDQAGDTLTRSRLKAGDALAAAIVDGLAGLGIPHARMVVETVPTEASEAGPSGLRFRISTNKGEDPKPLAKIASGGEISRVMLALKGVVARDQRLPVMVFDEIDTGISGAVSEAVGRRMRELSERCQILAITHQPQIAAQGHRHFRVEKVEEGDRTVSRLRLLDDAGRVAETAALMSGSAVTDAALESARQLIRSAAGT